MNPTSLLFTAILASVGQTTLAFTGSTSNEVASASARLMVESTSNRRNFLNKFGAIVTGTVISVPTISNALDFDAFEKGLVESDTKNCNPKLDPKCIPKLTPDEALCQYGKSGQARGEACMRVKQAGGKLPGVTKEKSLGGAYAM